MLTFTNNNAAVLETLWSH